MGIAFIDLQAQRARIEDKINAAITNVLDEGRFIMGPQVSRFEEQMAAFGNAKHALGCGNGTDALALPLLAWGIGPGDAVFCPSFTFAATGEIVPWYGATPIFVDILPGTYNIDPAKLEASIEKIKAEGKLTPKVIIAVDLFGQPADYPALKRIADKYGMKLVADSAQGFGCTLNGNHPLHWADVTTTSFFPAKPLGCYGDGGAVLTNCDETADIIRSLRVHGKGGDKYDNIRIGMNSRLDTLQAAILIEKLAIFADEIERRNVIASRYCEALKDCVEAVPAMIEGGISTWAQFTIEHKDREGLAAHLKANGIPSAIYYPKPMHMQTAYKDFPIGAGGLEVSEDKAVRVISLPMHPYLDEGTQDMIIQTVRGFNHR
ncbi:MAG: DegT/DnrJ/EryC1/StrS aminotransferase family protein [Robiginitomaculum sp.]|nr:DegT/DnrJ/EryC1/StrS aminotransferase family protein [Robiginitomaculum sp.]MDQ7076448.1 DegT/DnrJ/EryC1/StrS aminotransferase family protein [Robiginitomaculum sp.]